MKRDLRAIIPAFFIFCALSFHFGKVSGQKDVREKVKEAFLAGNQYMAAKSKFCIVDSVKELQAKMGDRVPTAAEAFSFLSDNMEPCNQKIVSQGIEEKVVREVFPGWNWPEGLKD